MIENCIHFFEGVGKNVIPAPFTTILALLLIIIQIYHQYVRVVALLVFKLQKKSMDHISIFKMLLQARQLLYPLRDKVYCY